MTAEPPKCKRFRLGWNWRIVGENTFLVLTPKHTEHIVKNGVCDCDYKRYNRSGECTHQQFMRQQLEKKAVRPKRLQPTFRLITHRKGEVGA